MNLTETNNLDITTLRENLRNNQSINFSFYVTIICLTVVFVYFLKKYMSGPYFDTSKYNLSGKYALVTGGNSGIGRETVLELVRLNCNVIIGARDRKNSQEVVKIAQKIIAQKQQKSNIIVEQYYLDLGSKKSIQEFSQTVHQRIPKIDYLINNAGVSMVPKHNKTSDGFEMTYGINHLGHFYLTSLLIDLLQKSQFFRIINVSSKAHNRLLGFGPKFTLDWENLNFTAENSYQHNLAYSRSKLCNVLFTKGLAKKIPQTKGICACLHPGVVQTQILRHQSFLQILCKVFHPLLWLMMKNSWQGAQTTLFTILDESVQSGEYYADCQKNAINEFALQEKNVQKLWTISEKDLGIKFEIRN